MNTGNQNPRTSGRGVVNDTNTLAPTDAEILALNAGEVHFSESPSKYPAAGFGTQYHAGAPGVLSFARAVLAKWGATAPASQPFAYEFSRSNGDGTHSEHIERGRLQEVAPGRWEHSGLPRGVLADKSIKALYTTPQTQPAAVPAGMEPVALLKFAVWDDGELRLLSGRKGPAFDCELYAMPDGKRAPDLFTAAQVQAMLAGAPTPPLTNIGDKP